MNQSVFKDKIDSRDRAPVFYKDDQVGFIVLASSVDLADKEWIGSPYVIITASDGEKEHAYVNKVEIYLLEDKTEAHEEKVNSLQADLEEKERELSVAETDLTDFEEENPTEKKKIQTKRETVERKQRAVGKVDCGG